MPESLKSRQKITCVLLEQLTYQEEIILSSSSAVGFIMMEGSSASFTLTLKVHKLELTPILDVFVKT